MSPQNPLIPAPPTTGPAIELRYLDLALDAARRQLRLLVFGAVAMWLLAAFALVSGGRTFVVVSIVGLAVLFNLIVLAQYLLVGPWLRAASRLFAIESWRPVAVRAVGKRWLDVEESGQVIRIRPIAGMDVLVRAIGRAERVWLVGPDEHGWVAVHVAGVRCPLPGRIVEERPATPPMEISAYDPEAPAAADAVTAKAARTLLWLPRRLYLPAMMVLAVGLGVCLGAVLSRVYLIALIGVPVVLVAAVLFARTRKRLGGWTRLRQLLEAGPWQCVSAELDERWRPGPRGSADAEATLTLPGGERLPVRMPMLGFDVAEYIRNTGTVWIAGEPGPSFAIGVPGSPILAVAVPDQLQSGPRRAQLHA